MNIYLAIFVSIVLVTFLFFITYRNKRNARRLVQLHEKGGQLLDVRSAEEFAAGSIKGAMNIPHNELGERRNELDKDKRYITFCSQGVRSVLGKKTLEKYGYNCFNGGSMSRLKVNLETK